MSKIIWILTACVFIGFGIGTGIKYLLAVGVTMYLTPFGIAVLHYLDEKS